MEPKLEIAPLPETTFGAVVSGVKLAELDAAAFAALYRAWLDHALLIFPDQHLTREQQIAFAKRFGAMEIEITPISNVKPDGGVRDDDDVVKILKGNMFWHADSTYMPVQAKGAVFTAHVVPPAGGETGFADMRAAYDALTPQMRARIETLSAYHSLAYSQAKLDHKHEPGSAYSGYGMTVKAPPLRPLVKRHPETGRPALAIGRHAYGIPGLSAEESDALLAELTDFACQAPRVHYHHWRAGDAIVWDNRCLLHRACAWNLAEPRVMYHSRIAGHPLTEFAAGA
jgi:alpha-ketoglutarate-dependent taurine dioxygenase